MKRFIEGEGRKMFNLGFVTILGALVIDRFYFGMSDKDHEFIRLILGCGIFTAMSVALMTIRKDFFFNF